MKITWANSRSCKVTAVDHTGESYGSWTVCGPTQVRNGTRYVEATCVCGKTKSHNFERLKKLTTKSNCCDSFCQGGRSRRESYAGLLIGDWFVVGDLTRGTDRYVSARCRYCGRERQHLLQRLKKGRVRQCHCPGLGLLLAKAVLAGDANSTELAQRVVDLGSK